MYSENCNPKVNKKLILYGSYLVNCLKSSLVPPNSVYLFIGEKSWDYARSFQVSRPGTLCLPAYLSPVLFIWPVLGCDILVFDTGYSDEDYIDEVMHELMTSGAAITRFIDVNMQMTAIYKRDF